MYRLKQLTLILADFLIMYAALYLAVFLRNFSLPDGDFSLLLRPMAYLFALAVIINFISGLYDLRYAKNSRGHFTRVLIAGGIWIIVGLIFFYFRHDVAITPKTILLLNGVIGYSLLALWRFFYNKFISTTFLTTRVIFAGFTPEVEELINLFNKEPQRGYCLTGIIKADNLPDHLRPLTCAEPCDKTNADIIVLAPSLNLDSCLLKELYDGLFTQKAVVGLADFYADIFKRIPPFTFSEAWFIANLEEQNKKIYDRARLVFDWLAAVLVGIFFAATFPFVALAIKLSSPGPIFFTQKRVGRNGRDFKLYKYRTMKALASDGSAEVAGPRYAEVEDPRITFVGKFLRRARLDELPQFINIFKNEMAIVGPRPERPEFVAELTRLMPFYSLRHLIKPGITGWAQVHNAYYGTLDENLRKLEYDLFYIKNRGPSFDISIILRTINILARMAGR